MEFKKNVLENGDLELVLVLDQFDQICLEHDLIDVSDWFSKGPSFEKIQSCKKRMIKEYKDVLMKKPENMNKTLKEINELLEDERELVMQIKALPEYKNRLEREKI